MKVPCILDCRSSVAPILRPFHRPSHPVSSHLDLECAQVCPSLQVLNHQDRQCSHVHPNHLVSLPRDPESVNLHTTIKQYLEKFVIPTSTRQVVKTNTVFQVSTQMASHYH